MVILKGSIVNELIEKLEESMANLNQMLTMKHVKPFREDAEELLSTLSDVNDILERWIKLQQLWMSLESVFTSGDIARQMPTDTRTFLKVDKEWCSRFMAKAKVCWLLLFTPCPVVPRFEKLEDFGKFMTL